jgi:hypothetical protein
MENAVVLLDGVVTALLEEAHARLAVPWALSDVAPLRGSSHRLQPLQRAVAVQWVLLT